MSEPIREISRDVVPPPESSSDVRAPAVVRVLVEVGVPEETARWLGPLLGRPGVLPEPRAQRDHEGLAPSEREDLRWLASRYRAHRDDPAIAGTHVLAALLGYLFQSLRDATGGRWQVAEDVERDLVSGFVGPPANTDLTEGVLALVVQPPRDVDPLDVARFGERLANLGALDVPRLTARAVPARIRQVDEFRAGGTDLITPERLELSIGVGGPAALEAFLPTLCAEPDETVGALAMGITICMGNWSNLRKHVLLDHHAPEVWERFEPVLEKYVAALEERRARRPEDRVLRRAWWRFVLRAYLERPNAVSDSQRRILLETAREAWGRARPFFREAKPETAIPRFNAEFLSWQDAMFVLATFGGLWAALHPLLLAFRVLGAASVGPDLRYWAEHPLPTPPVPWNWIPQLISGVIHTFAGRERKTDPTLARPRAAFADYCAERLGTMPAKRRDRHAPADAPEVLVEPDPYWRYAYVRALRTLRSDPGGRAHRVLFWVAEHDAEPDVRKAAREAYDQVRRADEWPRKLSPKAAVLGAAFMLRFAHAKAHGVKLDPPGVRRTIAREMRRTKEADTNK